MNEVTEQKPFLRWNNPWLWVMGLAGFMIYQHEKKGKPVSKKGNPLAFYPGEKKTAEDPERSKTQVGACGLGLSTLVRNPMHGEFMITDTDSKTGKGLVWCFSLPRGRPKDTGGTCVAATPWCAACCYGMGTTYIAYMKARVDPSLSRHYGGNYEIAKKTIGNPDYFADKMLDTLKLLEKKKNHPRVMRVHVVGDFFHPDYVRAWTKVVKSSAKDGWKFYAYTRTWRIPAFEGALNELRKQPNFNLLLSTDPSSGRALIHWKECGIDLTYNSKGVVCDHATDKHTTCYACGKCWDHNGPSVFIPVHGLTKEGKIAHEKYTTERKDKYGFNPKRRPK